MVLDMRAASVWGSCRLGKQGRTCRTLSGGWYKAVPAVAGVTQVAAALQGWSHCGAAVGLDPLAAGGGEGPTALARGVVVLPRWLCCCRRRVLHGV